MVFFNGKCQKNGLFFVDQNMNFIMGKVILNYGIMYGGMFEYNFILENFVCIEFFYFKVVEEGRLWL